MKSYSTQGCRSEGGPVNYNYSLQYASTITTLLPVSSAPLLMFSTNAAVALQCCTIDHSFCPVMLCVLCLLLPTNGLSIPKPIQRQLIYVNRNKLLYEAYWPIK